MIIFPSCSRRAHHSRDRNRPITASGFPGRERTFREEAWLSHWYVLLRCPHGQNTCAAPGRYSPRSLRSQRIASHHGCHRVTHHSCRHDHPTQTNSTTVHCSRTGRFKNKKQIAVELEPILTSLFSYLILLITAHRNPRPTSP